jgi:hypothetical protein
MNFLPLIRERPTRRLASLYSEVILWLSKRKLVFIREMTEPAGGTRKVGQTNSLIPLIKERKKPIKF